MENSTLEVINRHGSVRRYKPDPVPEALIARIVGAGQRAATSSNLQMYSVVVTVDLADREKFQQISGGQAHITQAPVFLTWCADLSRLDRICQSLGYRQETGYVENLLLAVTDTAIAAQNAALAAESFGLGFCYIGAIRNDPRQVIRMLKLPHLVFPLFGMTLGWPAGTPMVRPRLPLEAILHWGSYDPEGEADLLQDYDRLMVETGIYQGRQVGAENPLPAMQYGWTEHSARRVAQVQRPHLREVLQEQGFELK